MMFIMIGALVPLIPVVGASLILAVREGRRNAIAQRDDDADREA